MRWDYMIVGQGLAGSILAYTLLSRGRNVLVFDDPEQAQASQAAAGIYNPFTGRNLVKTWMLDHLFPFLETFYRQMETALGAELLHSLPMLRPLVSVKEQNLWGTKIQDPVYNTYIEGILTSEEMPEDIRSEFGGLMLKRCGYVDTEMLINATAKMLDDKTSLVKERFEIEDLLIEDDSVSYHGRTARKIIFCEGPNLSNNQYFKWLPLRPVKGETLLVELSRPLPYILNRGVFLLPVFENRAVVGATFDNRELNWKSSDKGRDELEHKLRTLTSRPYKVIAQKAGIRPATKDRRPFVGIHPRYEPLGVFNGLGTKGVSLAPYFAHEFSEFLEHGIPLTNEVTISRYFILYYD